MRKIRADGEMVDALQVDLIASECEVVVAEKSDERFEVIAICVDGVDGDVPLVGEIVKKLADFVRHARAPGAMVNGMRRAARIAAFVLAYAPPRRPPWQTRT
jgi:hypothetical protein